MANSPGQSSNPDFAALNRIQQNHRIGIMRIEPLGILCRIRRQIVLPGAEFEPAQVDPSR